MLIGKETPSQQVQVSPLTHFSGLLTGGLAGSEAVTEMTAPLMVGYSYSHMFSLRSIVGKTASEECGCNFVLPLLWVTIQEVGGQAIFPEGGRGEWGHWVIPTI